MFSLESEDVKIDMFKKIKVVNGSIRQDEIEDIMKKEDFIFL